MVTLKTGSRDKVCEMPKVTTKQWCNPFMGMNKEQGTETKALSVQMPSGLHSGPSKNSHIIRTAGEQEWIAMCARDHSQ